MYKIITLKNKYIFDSIDEALSKFMTLSALGIPALLVSENNLMVTAGLKQIGILQELISLI